MPVTSSPSAFADALQDAVERGFAAMGVVHALVAGALSRDTLVGYAARYYAELRTFIDVKLPERLRLCPYGATRAKEFFARAYVEEQGHFRPGEDHASLFRRLCDALEISPGALEDETRRYARRFRYLRELEPSAPAMVRELAIAYAWESAAPALGQTLARALGHHYGVPAAALEFFELHRAVDREHSAEALRVLRAYADRPELQQLALGAIAETLDLRNYFEPEGPG
jgi:pyrroloquinoline quinone (PQQ) biosynthesis protein C